MGDQKCESCLYWDKDSCPSEYGDNKGFCEELLDGQRQNLVMITVDDNYGLRVITETGFGCALWKPKI